MPRAITKCPRCGANVTHYAVGCAVCGEDIAVLLALAAPLFGLLISCWFAWQIHQEGRPAMRNIMLLVAVLAALPMLTGVYLWGRFVGGL